MISTTPRLRRVVSLVAIVSLASGAGACSGTPRIGVDAAEARLAPMLVGVCSIFMKIANPGDGDDALVDAQVDVPGATAQIHAFRDGRMVQSGKLVVPAKGVLELRPGGPHIMLFNLPKDSGPGYEFTVRLKFERSGELRTPVKISG
jgi:hypothetical protein